MTTSLKGKFILNTIGPDAGRTGRIVKRIDDHFYLVQWDSKPEEPSPLPMCIYDLTTTYNSMPVFCLFNTQSDMRRWVDFLNHKVVKLRAEAKND